MNPEAYVAVVLDMLADNPSIPADVVLMRLLEGLQDSTFPLMAKRDLATGQLSWIQISSFGAQRGLLEHVENEPESAFRDSVHQFETDALDGGAVFPPAVIAVDEWRRYDERRPFQSP